MTWRLPHMMEYGVDVSFAKKPFKTRSFIKHLLKEVTYFWKENSTFKKKYNFLPSVLKITYIA